MILICIISFLMVIVSAYKRDEKLLIVSSFFQLFTIFNIFSQDVVVSKPIVVIDRSDVFYSLIIDLYIQFIVVFFAGVVSFSIAYILWILINKESIEIKPFLIKNYKIVSVILSIYIVLSLYFKEIEVMWLSFFYLVYFILKGFFAKNLQIRYIKDTNLKLEIIKTIILLIVVSIFFSYISFVPHL